jgi:hypothetical protein
MDVRDQRYRNARVPGLVFALASLLPAVAQAQEDTGGSVAASTDVKVDGTTPSEPEAPDPRPKNPANYEFGFVNVSAFQAFAIAGRWLYFGIGGGVGPALYRYGKLGDNEAGWDPNIEIVHGAMFLRVAPAPFIDIDIGPRLALGAATYNVKDPPNSSFSAGGYVDLRIGTEKLKFGPRFEYANLAYADTSEKGWRITPLMVRVMH